jgi:hypothetical protein
MDITLIKKMYCCPSDTQEAFFASLKPRSIKATTIGGTNCQKACASAAQRLLPGLPAYALLSKFGRVPPLGQAPSLDDAAGVCARPLR